MPTYKVSAPTAMGYPVSTLIEAATAEEAMESAHPILDRLFSTPPELTAEVYEEPPPPIFSATYPGTTPGLVIYRSDQE